MGWVDCCHRIVQWISEHLASLLDAGTYPQPHKGPVSWALTVEGSLKYRDICQPGVRAPRDPAQNKEFQLLKDILQSVECRLLGQRPAFKSGLPLAGRMILNLTLTSLSFSCFS